MPKLRKISQEEYDLTPEYDDDSFASDSDAKASASRYQAERYPHLAAWIDERGWVEFGADHYSSSAIRILDIGGMVWESEHTYQTLDAALAAADAALAELEADGEL